MKKVILGISVCLLTVIGCSKNEMELKDVENVNFQKVLTTSQINDEIKKVLIETQEPYNWEKASPLTLWSAIQYGDGEVSIGFGENKNDFEKAESKQANQIETTLLTLIAQYENASIDEILIEKSSTINGFDVKIKNPKTLLALRNHKNIRYVEPVAYSYESYEAINSARISSNNTLGDGAGCNFNTNTINAADLKLSTKGLSYPWNFDAHKIKTAWDRGWGGQGITIGIIDTGLNKDRSVMNGAWFTNGQTGRTSQRLGSFVPEGKILNDGNNDLCGHGTSTAAVATAPLRDGSISGVANRASVIAYRASEDVTINDNAAERAVKRAFEEFGKTTSPVKIISMSMGRILASTSITDIIRVAATNGKLIFCAAGTTTWFTGGAFGVIYPASMSEVVAVTGITDNSFQNVRCKQCHTGPKVDFSAVMERNADEVRSVPVVGYNNGTFKYFGGSSVATAMVAGMAAIIWSKNPTWDKTKVLDKMKASAQYFPNKDPNNSFGYGVIDLDKATK